MKGGETVRTILEIIAIIVAEIVGHLICKVLDRKPVRLFEDPPRSG